MLISPMSGNTLGGAGSSFVVAEWTQEGTPAGDLPMWVAPLHRHRTCDEGWYVLDGTLCVQIDGETFTAQPGDAIWAKPGTAHTYWNPNPEPVRYLLTMT